MQLDVLNITVYTFVLYEKHVVLFQPVGVHVIQALCFSGELLLMAWDSMRF